MPNRGNEKTTNQIKSSWNKSTYIVITLLTAAMTATSQRIYPVSVVGVQVTDSNSSNITGPFISGTVKYQQLKLSQWNPAEYTTLTFGNEDSCKSHPMS